MIFKETPLKGAYLIEQEPVQDERGFFSRTFCRREFEGQGIHGDFVQCNMAFNRHRGTLRGMHFQAAPHEEIKLVSCIRGRIYDVIIDLRPASQSFRQWHAIELSEDNRLVLYVPKGFAHGFQTLEDDCVVSYHMSEFYCPDLARGVRWNDPAFPIPWPDSAPVISDKDLGFADFRP
jgi:dTDP-4-dehydrorhamnose 3,5-epimerase